MKTTAFPPLTPEEKATRDAGKTIEAFRRDLDRVVSEVAHEEKGRIHPDMLRMPMVALALSNAALRSVGKEQLRAFLIFCVRAGLQPGKTVEADIVPNAETGALELRPRIEFASLIDAERITLPGELGNPKHFDGMGGQPIGLCDTGILRGVLVWLASPQRPNRPVTHARLSAAIATVLRAREGATVTQETAE